MKPRILARSFIAVAACGLMAIVGCSASNNSSSSSPIAQAKSSTGKQGFTPASDIASCPSGPSGTLNFVGDIGGPYAVNFNPFSASTNTGAQFSFVYESLLQYSLSQQSVTPWLASAYSWSNGGKSLTFNLRQGITWNDGKPFTSADVVYTFNLLKQNPATNLKAIVFNTITATSKYSVTMTFATPEYTELFYIGTQYIVPQHIWSTISNPTKALNLKPVGTGPYELTTLTAQSMILTANPHYWQPNSPCVKAISAPPYVSNTTADLEMEQGGGDWGGLYVAGMSRYTNGAGHDYWNPPTNDVALYPNLTVAPLNSQPLRQAISDTLDRPKIEQLGEEGEETPITNPTGLILPRDKAQLAPQYASAAYKVDPAKAKSILTAAGYKYSGSTLLTPAGKPVAFSITAPAAYSDWVAAAQEVVSELTAIGIDAKLNAEPVTQWVSDMQLGHFQMAFTAGFLGPDSFYQYNAWLATSGKVGTLAPNNFERYSDPATDKLLNAYLATNDAATKQQIMTALEGVMVNDLPVIPLYYATDWGLYTTTHFTGWPSPSNPYEIASSYDTPMNEIVLLHLKPVQG